ncbi:unnamed protein product [Darwinula stevensoni]|uniref:Uncharacterized protein n=1 Tax=Darwinula stevensoni TaxID=69355 RepID=A0A7R8XCH9_9CRUS|nr:unnamed protein product [Darwinula stevensoni]CAG0888854.1 unnamed protein product [Darwinula stevensoni]
MFTASEQRICCSIGICLLIAVLSGVALLNLTVYVTFPAMRLIDANFQERPVVCTTLDAADNIKEGCEWGTCGEWCLSKSSGCMQIWVLVRQNGSDMKASGCQGKSLKQEDCYPVTIEEIKSINCAEKECKQITMDGLFICKEGKCKEITNMFTCPKDVLEENVKNCKTVFDCEELDGLYQCSKSLCQRLVKEDPDHETHDSADPHYIPRELTECKETCTNVRTERRNMLVLHGYSIFMATCTKLSTADGKHVLPWDGNQTAMVICSRVSNTSMNQKGEVQLNLHDCFHGVEVKLEDKGYSIKDLMSIHKNSDSGIDPDGHFMPLLDEGAVIYNKTRLMVNLEGCVNSLRDECREIFNTMGKDGQDGVHPPAIFPCYYSPHLSDTVILKHNRERTVMEGILFAAIPLESEGSVRMRSRGKKIGGGDAGQKKEQKNPSTVMEKTASSPCRQRSNSTKSNRKGSLKSSRINLYNGNAQKHTSYDDLGPDVEVTWNEYGIPIVTRRAPPFQEKFKFVMTVLCSLTIILDCFVFLFLIPFVIDPCISTILAQFSEDPALCITSNVNRLVGNTNCSWSSCREGCTAPTVRCTQIYVHYMTRENHDYPNLLDSATQSGQLPTSEISSYRWNMLNAALYINTKGCGYSPYVICSDFEDMYGYIGKLYECHYSFVNMSRVVVEYSPQENLLNLILASGIPFILFVIPTSILCCWYCNCCRESSCCSDPSHDSESTSSNGNGMFMPSSISAQLDAVQSQSSHYHLSPHPSRPSSAPEKLKQ